MQMAPQDDKPGAALVAAPDWIDDLILYEVATKGYTSPNGPESGTFASLRLRLPYLAELGVTGIWLTGHSLGHPTHFYNVWTQYAVIEPDKLDPSLGSEEDFHALIESAHAHGIRVFLEVVTHGVMSESSLVREKPHWFKGGSWGMVDFDWDNPLPERDNWWVDLWSDMVVRYGIDGFRLDVAVYRWDLWQRIRARALAAGHPIAIVTEHGPGYLGVNDIFQRGAICLSTQTRGLKHDSPLLTDLAGYFQRRVKPHSSAYQVRVIMDNGDVLSTAGTNPQLRIASQRHEREVVRNDAGAPIWERWIVTLQVEGGLPETSIEDVVVADEEGQEWHWRPWVEADCRLNLARTSPSLCLQFAEKYPPGWLLAVQLSSHDNGWEGSPLDENPYVAQGSRFVFGYAFMLAPAIPLFMSGEEFDAEYRPLPGHSPKLFGGELPGRGRWLYASWLDWSQLQDSRRAAMLDDVKRLIAIRKRFRHLIRPLRVGDEVSHLLAAEITTESAAPKPYLYHNGDECLLIAGNPNADADLRLRITLPLRAIGWGTDTLLTVTDLWRESPSQMLQAREFADVTHIIQRDKTPRGGLLVLHLRRHTSNRA